MGKEFKKKYMHPTRRKLVDMVETGTYDKNTTVGYTKKQETRNIGDVWEDEHNKYEKKEGYILKTGKNSEALQEIRKYLEEKSIFHQPGLNEELGATAVWTGVPSCVTVIHEPLTLSLWCDRNKADGLVTSFNPFSVMAKTPNSFTAPKRFFAARIILKLELGSPSKYRTVSTICSKTLGPAKVPSLVT